MDPYSRISSLGEAADWGHALAVDLADYRAGRIAWADVDRGALVAGPPGTGKTTFALALGRTCGVPVFVHSLAQWQAAGYLNALLKSMREAFAEAVAAAPCILFVDELDSFGDRANEGDRNATYTREVINGFLECLDGAEARTGVVVIGATNHPHLIDPAIRREGASTANSRSRCRTRKPGTRSCASTCADNFRTRVWGTSSRRRTEGPAPTSSSSYATRVGPLARPAAP